MSECPVCEAFKGLCQLLAKDDPEKGRKCWELLARFIEEASEGPQKWDETSRKLADELLKLDPKKVVEWLKGLRPH